MVSCIPGKDFRGVRFLPIGGDDKKEEKVETPTPIVEEKEESVKEEESGNPFAEKEEKKDEAVHITDSEIERGRMSEEELSSLPQMRNVG